jgi:hypothetical protein
MGTSPLPNAEVKASKYSMVDWTAVPPNLNHSGYLSSHRHSIALAEALDFFSPVQPYLMTLLVVERIIRLSFYVFESQLRLLHQRQVNLPSSITKSLYPWISFVIGKVKKALDNLDQQELISLLGRQMDQDQRNHRGLPRSLASFS